MVDYNIFITFIEPVIYFYNPFEVKNISKHETFFKNKSPGRGWGDSSVVKNASFRRPRFGSQDAHGNL